MAAGAVATARESAPGTTDAPADGRSTRWQAHRLARREELVGAALRAISRHGPDVGMDEIAAVAGTSKTVLYRHFADKEQLHRAVAARIDVRVAAALRTAVAGATGFRQGLRATIGAYLHLVAQDPAVYRFVVRRGPSIQGGVGSPDAAGDPVAGLSAAVGTELTRLIDAHLPPGRVTGAAASAWGHGLVGMVRAAADHWLDERETSLSADELAGHLTDLAWGGLGPVLTDVARTADPTATAAPTTPQEQAR